MTRILLLIVVLFLRVIHIRVYYETSAQLLSVWLSHYDRCKCSSVILQLEVDSSTILHQSLCTTL